MAMSIIQTVQPMPAAGPGPVCVPPAAAPRGVFQIGAGWFPEFSGGGESALYHMFRLLPGQGMAVRGAVLGSAEVARQSDGAVCGFAARSASLPARLWGARRAIGAGMDAGDCDVVASHFALFTLPGLDLIRSRPLVVHFHGPWAEESRAEGSGQLSVLAKAAVERRVYRQAQRYIAVSHCFARLLAETYRVDPALITVNPGGVDSARFAVPSSRAQARDKLGWSRDRKIILTVRRLARRMGLGQLIRSMVEVRLREPDALLLIAGKGSEAQALAALIEELHLTEHVKLIGFVSNALLPFAYRAADLTIVSSTSLEGFGLITIESLAAGTPVLVTPVGGLPEAVRPLAPQLVLAGCTPAEMADGLKGALGGTLELPEDAACRRYAHDHFDWSVVAERARKVYIDAAK